MLSEQIVKGKFLQARDYLFNRNIEVFENYIRDNKGIFRAFDYEYQDIDLLNLFSRMYPDYNIKNLFY